MADDIVIEVNTSAQTVETTTPVPVTINNVTNGASVIETTLPAIQDLNVVIAQGQVVEVFNTAKTIDVTPPSSIDVEVATGPRGTTPVLWSGAAPPNPATGQIGDLYLVNTGATIGDLYQKTKDGWGTATGNLTGGIHSVNGISGTDIIVGANNITTGVLPLAQIPTGTTGTTVALGNHNHAGVYEPVIAAGLSTQYLRGDKTWQTLDKAAVGLGSVPNIDTTNAANISSGTLAIGRIPTGTTGTTVALGNHNHDAAYVALTGTQTVAGTKTFSAQIISNAGSEVLQLKAAAGDHTYMGFYARTASQGTRSGYIGYGGAGVTTLSIINEITNGAVNIQSNGTADINLVAPNVAVSTKVSTPALRVGTSATAGYVLTADASGNATWQQTANIIVPGTTAQYYRGDLTWATLDKAAVGLGNVDNTSDAAKPLSTAATTALAGKEPTIAAGLATQYWRGDKTWQTLDKATISLGNVDNTSDVNKPISTATQTALNAKENTIAAGTTAQYYRGDKSWQALTATAVGLGNVANVAQVDLTSGQTITGAKIMNNASNVFTGNGAALTALNASELASGTVPQARVTPNIQRMIITTGSEARPTGTSYVEWIGPVNPTNASTDDTWIDTSIGVIEDPAVGMPIGTVQMYAGTGAPTNWLTCDGQAVSRSTYSALFSLISTTYGSGDGTTTFNLPNLKGRVPVGFDATQTEFDAMGETGGEKAHVNTIAEMPAHNHGGATGGQSADHSHGQYVSAQQPPYSPAVRLDYAGDAASSPYPQGINTGGASNDHTHAISSQGGGAAHNNLQPYITMNFIIKVL